MDSRVVSCVGVFYATADVLDPVVVLLRSATFYNLVLLLLLLLC